MTGLILKPKGLSDEFIRLGNGAGDWSRIESGLRVAGVLRTAERMTAYSDCEPWHRGGGETYVADAIIEVAGGSESSRHVIAKAVVSFATSLEAKLEVLLTRRAMLTKLGIAVPELYSARDAMVLEEFIDRPIGETDLADEGILQQVGCIAAKLDCSGFTTLSFLSDMRVKDGCLYYVDFGFDLGEPSGSRTKSALHAIEKSVPSEHVDSCLRSYSVTLSREV